ncbi:hypothetical protein TNCV_4264931 [Trichonephila clavipes]|nr:hypothetical protein TNCV_4264931 [Trichonephila clavipes]
MEVKFKPSRLERANKRPNEPTLLQITDECLEFLFSFVLFNHSNMGHYLQNKLNTPGELRIGKLLPLRGSQTRIVPGESVPILSPIVLIQINTDIRMQSTMSALEDFLLEG